MMFGNFSAMKRKGSLRYWIMYLIYSRPMNGAEIMDEIERHSFGLWRPSPGSVYPALEAMAAEGLITKRPDGRYEIAEKGKEELGIDGLFQASSPKTVDSVIEEMHGFAEYLEDLVKGNVKLTEAEREKIRDIVRRLEEISKM